MYHTGCTLTIIIWQSNGWRISIKMLSYLMKSLKVRCWSANKRMLTRRIGVRFFVCQKVKVTMKVVVAVVC